MNSIKDTKYLYAVVLDGFWYATKFEIAKESDKIYFLTNGAAVHKGIMHDFQDKIKTWYYADKKEAERVLRIKECSFLLNKYANGSDCETRFDTIKLANADELADIFINMIYELCEDGVPSAEIVKKWLLSAPDEEGVNKDVSEIAEDDALEREDYSALKDGDTIYYVDFDSNKIEQGIACGVRRKNPDNSVTYLSLDMPNDFMGCTGKLLGEIVFLDKDLAEKKLRRGKENV